MRYCEKCGKEIGEDSKFCPFCGQQRTAAGGTLSGGNKKLIFGGIGAAVLVIVIVLAVVFTRKTPFTPSDFITVDFTGADGYGRVSCNFDSGKAMDYLRTKKKMDPKDELVIESHLYSLYPEASKYDHLSNGEKIEVTCSSAPDVLDEYGIKINDEEAVIKVSGLKEMQDADGTEMLTVKFSGANPGVQVEMNLNEEDPLYPYINWDEFYDIPTRISAKNGDTYTAEIPFDEENALYNGYRITNKSKEFVVSGVGNYDYALEDLNDEELQTMIADGMEVVRLYIPRQEDNILEELSGGNGTILWSKMKCAFMKAVKCYSPEGYYGYNRNAFVYTASLPVMNLDESVSVYTVYVTYYIDNLKEEADGTFFYDSANAGNIYSSEEALEADVAQMPEALGVESTVCTITELVNENAASEIEQESLDAPEEAQVEYTELKAPELSADIAAAAVADVEFNGHRYYLFDEDVAWNEAKASCEVKGGHLATVSGQTEQWLLNSLREQGSLDNYWIGASDAESEGNWKWVTDEAFDYTCWDDDEPDNYDGAEHCAALFGREDGRWGDLSYDADWTTGYILELEPQIEENDDGIVLSDCDFLTEHEKSYFSNWADDTYGRRYYGPLALDADAKGWAKFELNGAYTRMTGRISVYSEAANGANMEAAFFGDGKLLARRCTLDRQNQGEPFEIDLTGVNTLTIVTANRGETGEGWVLIGDPKIYGGGEKGETEIRRLNDVHCMGTASTKTAVKLWRDSDGVLHEGYREFNTSEKAGAVWYLNGEYTEFSAKLAGFYSEPDTKMNVRIYGDDELLYELKDWNRMQEGSDFTVDVTGKKILRIETENGSENYDSYIYLTDDRLVRPVETSEAENAAAEEEETAATAPVFDAEFAPAGQAAYDGHYYYLFKEEMEWKQAKQFCEEMGGHLAVITSPLEQRRVEQLMEKADGNDSWIGGTDEKQEGSWKWVTGEEFDYTNWGYSQPDNYQHGEEFENHMEMSGWDGSWNDLNGTELRGFILEISDDHSQPGNSLEIGELFDRGRAAESEGFDYKSGVTDVKGKEHLSAHMLNPYSGGYAKIALNGEFTRFTGKIANHADTEWYERVGFGIFGDGKCLYESVEYRGWEEEEPFDVDVTGVKTLTIRCNTIEEYDAGYLLLYDTNLEKAESPSLNEKTADLASVQQIDCTGFEREDYLVRDNLNHAHDGNFRMDVYGESYAVYLLDGEYTEFTGMFTAGDDTEYNDSVRVEVYADDEILFEQSGITVATEPAAFTLDVTGKNRLKIVAYDETERGRGIVYLTDGRLK